MGSFADLIDDSLKSSMRGMSDRACYFELERFQLFNPETYGASEVSNNGPSVPCGYPRIDEMTKGFHPGQLVAIAGCPRVGKSSLALNMALNMASQGTKVCYFSLEMSYREVVARWVALISSLPFRWFNDEISAHQRSAYGEAMRYLWSLPIVLDDTPVLTLADLRRKVRKTTEGCEGAVVIVDYLQIISPIKGVLYGGLERGACNSGYRLGVDMASCSYLKDAVQELGLTVIVLSQAHKRYAIPSDRYREDKNHVERYIGYPLDRELLLLPKCVESFADVVAFIDRPMADEEVDRGLPSTKSRADLHIVKNNQGPTGIVELEFDSALRSFSSID